MLQTGKSKQKHRRLLKSALSCNPCAALLLALGGGVNSAISKGFGIFWNIGEFRSLRVEKEEKFYSSRFRLIVFPHPLKFMSLRGNSHSARSNLERILQLKTLVCVEFYNNMDCRVARAPRNDIQSVVLPTNPSIYPRNDAQPGVPQRPITAPTSQVGEAAVVRTLVSYKCGWGSNKKFPPCPLKFMSLRGNSHSARSNLERILQLKTVGLAEPDNKYMDCRIAPAPRNDAKLVGLPTSQNIYPRNDTQLVVLPTSPSIYPKGGAHDHLRN